MGGTTEIKIEALNGITTGKWHKVCAEKVWGKLKEKRELITDNTNKYGFVSLHCSLVDKHH